MHDVALHSLACGFPCVAAEHSLLVHADCLDWLAKADENAVSAIVTDPPYGVKEYEAAEIERLQNGNRGGVWRLPPNFDGSERAPLPRFTAFDAKGTCSFDRVFHRVVQGRVARHPAGRAYVRGFKFLPVC